MTTLSCPAPADDRPASRTAALLSLGALAGLFLAACGDGGPALMPPAPPPPPPAPSTQVPASAADSTASLEAFAISQPPSETAEPLTLELVPTFPTSETEDPIVVG